MRRLSAFTLIVMLGLAFLAGTAARARAEAFPPAMSNGELNRVRAGYVSADGVTFAFGVALQTIVNGQLVLSSTMNVVNDAGATYSASGPLATGAGPGISATLAGGATTLLQQFTPMGAQNVIATSASNQTILQNVNVTLALAGFQQNQAADAVHGVVSNLGAQLLNGFLTGR